MMRKILNWLIIFLPAALPLYVVRFYIGPLPTTLLEIYILALIVTWLLWIMTNAECRMPNAGIAVRYLNIIRSSLFGIRSSIGPWLWPILAWLVVTLIAVFIAQDSWGAFGHWRAFMLEPVLVFIVLLDTWRKEKLDKIFISIAVVTILLGAYAVVQYVTGWGIPSPWDSEIGRRATGIFGYPNGLSLFIVPFGIVSFIITLTPNPSHLLGRGARWIFVTASALGLIAAVLAKSMGGILAFGIGVVLTLIIFKKTRTVGLVLAILGVLGAGLVAWNIHGTELHPQTIEDTLSASKKWSSSVRIIIWKESFEIIKDNPILGTGLRSYKTAILPYHEATWMETFPHPHNILLMLWIETGFLGLLTFLWLVGTWIYIVKRQRIKDEGIDQLVWIVPLIVILAHGMVDMPYFKNDLAVQFFLLAAIATICGKNSEAKQQ